jgi:hypothetical protein
MKCATLAVTVTASGKILGSMLILKGNQDQRIPDILCHGITTFVTI